IPGSLNQINYYLNNHGYFNSDITHTLTYPKKRPRNAKVVFNITTYAPYKINKVSYSISDATLKAFVYSEKKGCRLVPGEIYNIDNLDAERERITRTLRNNGYYFFSREYITFAIDSSLNSHQVDIRIKISDALAPAENRPDSMITMKHRRYSINKIIVNTDFETDKNKTVKYDTVKVIIPARQKNHPHKVYYYVFSNKLRINKKTLSQSIYVDSGDIFTISDVEKTYKSLLDLKIYRFVNITFRDLNQTGKKTGELECYIRLTKAPTQAVALSVETTNKGGELGLSAGVIYENKSLFRGADLFNVKVNGAIEFQSLKKDAIKESPVIKSLPFINTVETGIELNLKIPRFVIPVKQEKIPKYFKPKTNLNTLFNYQKRPDYERYYLSGSVGYQWKASEYATHILTPFQVNLIKISPDSTFKAQIDALNNKTLQNAYRDHITTSLTYSFIFNTQQINKNKDFIYFRTNMELAGFIFWASNQIRKKQGAYTLLGLPYSQYFRLDADFRYYMVFNEQNRMVYRAYAGYGSPFDNKNVLPFEKSFYLGGANSMRGWRMKTLGPGGYKQPDSLSLEKIGDISLEFNIEYRFPIYKILRGAVFVDAGNIWLRKPSNQLPLAAFNARTFLGELAFDAGLGLRADFGYFVIRLDGATILKDPSMPLHQRWVGQNNKKFKIIGNLGIGYPF
ncbi:MAG TPA: BamA/TamA family outer membrane protein, partial [Bacteroidales bacterium]|nr:BamA/TamA family outer membrane protein [Bacteroidales bacterium]